MGNSDGPHDTGGSKRSSPRSSPRDRSSKSGQSPEHCCSSAPEASQDNVDPSVIEQQQGLLHGNAVIEAGGSDEDGEFSASSVSFQSSHSDFDDDDDDRSSEGRGDESISLRTSVYEHSYANGRRYHRYRHGRYPIPNDESEQNREDMLHAMMLEATDGRLFYAPLGEHPRRIIDLGTGTGLWAIEMGEMYPGAEVLGLDLSPIQPPWVPPNVKFVTKAGQTLDLSIPGSVLTGLCRFYVDDVEASWLNGPDFDFVHLRNMVPILKSPVKVLQQAYANMRPGAWVELQDVDGDVSTDDDSVPDDWPIKRFTELMIEAFAKFGTDSHASAKGAEYLHEAGFVNIQHNYVKLPYGTWPKDKLMRLVGMYYRKACEEFFPAVGALHFPMLGWDRTEMEVFFAECRRAMRDPSVHAYGKMHFWSGQKPWDEA